MFSLYVSIYILLILLYLHVSLSLSLSCLIDMDNIFYCLNASIIPIIVVATLDSRFSKIPSATLVQVVATTLSLIKSPSCSSKNILKVVEAVTTGAKLAGRSIYLALMGLQRTLIPGVTLVVQFTTSIPKENSVECRMSGGGMRNETAQRWSSPAAVLQRDFLKAAHALLLPLQTAKKCP